MFGIHLGNIGRSVAPALALMGPAGAPMLNYYEQQEMNRRNQNNINRQMSWEAGMSNTAHQREVKDLQAAGLNPILSAGGNGSSTPSGGAAQLTAPQIDPSPIFQALSFAQAQQKIDIDKATAAAGIANTAAGTDLKQTQKAMMLMDSKKKGVQSEGWGMIQQLINRLKQTNKPPSKYQQELMDAMKYRDTNNFERLP